jgi:hypothetical protein
MACLTGSFSINKLKKIPVDSWIPASGLAEHTQLYEQSKALPAYGSVLSLLWLRR